MFAFFCAAFIFLSVNPCPNEAQLWNDLFSTKAPTVFGQKNDDCEVGGGVKGVCVPKDQCLNNTVIDDGRNRLIPRLEECTSSEVCCILPNSNPTPAKNDGNEPPPITYTNTSIPTESVGCGVRYEGGISDRVSGGISAIYGEFTWTVAVFKVVGNTEEFRCGASLIHPRAALSTALPTLRGKHWKVRAGDYDILSTSELQPHQTSDVTEIVRHKQFNSGTFSHNIALLFLATAIRVARNVGFACLPQPTMVTAPGTVCIVTGWGHDQLINGTLQNILKMLELPIVDRTTCQTQLRSVANPQFTLDSTNLCAGGESDNACRGDSGSPLVCAYQNESNRYYQAGIVSFGIGCGENGVPGVYTDVAGLRTWVDDEMRKKGYNDETYTP